jgi:2-polyprenyl-3-methyl-5-hydroxy-6-metoxy-1,4-benzoquinol methylase
MVDSAPPSTYAPSHAAPQITNHSWRTATNSAAYLLPNLASLASTNPSLRLLDVGCGPGTLTVSFASHLPPTAHIIGTDISSSVLSRAADHASEKGVANVEFKEADIYTLSSTFPNDQDKFDVVHAHQVFCHLNNPLPALQSMLSICKPGGIIALRESDLRMQTIHPETAGLRTSHDCLMQYHKSTGGSTSLGTELVSLAMKAGIPRENITATMGTWCISTREEREAWGGAFATRCRKGSPMWETATGNGWWSKQEMEGMARAWEEWIEAEDGVWGLMNGEVVIRKPVDWARSDL